MENHCWVTWSCLVRVSNWLQCFCTSSHWYLVYICCERMSWTRKQWKREACNSCWHGFRYFFCCQEISQAVLFTVTRTPFMSTSSSIVRERERERDHKDPKQASGHLVHPSTCERCIKRIFDEKIISLNKYPIVNSLRRQVSSLLLPSLSLW